MGIVAEHVRFIKILLTIREPRALTKDFFLVLKRLKSYLRSMTTQSRLNHVAILNIYPHEVDNLNMEELMNEFICKNPRRTSVFALLNNK